MLAADIGLVLVQLATAWAARHPAVSSVASAHARWISSTALSPHKESNWPAVHTLDAARLLRLALESAPPGSRLHAVADQGVPFRQIAETIGRHLDLPATSVAQDQAEQYLGYLAGFAGLDNPTSSAHTRQLLDWQPTGPGLLADLDAGHYFQAER